MKVIPVRLGRAFGGLGLLGLLGCSSANLVAAPKVVPVRDDRLSWTGSFCTDPPEPA